MSDFKNLFANPFQKPEILSSVGNPKTDKQVEAKIKKLDSQKGKPPKKIKKSVVLNNELQKLLFKAKEACPEASDEVIKKAIIEYLLKSTVDKYHGIAASKIGEANTHYTKGRMEEASKSAHEANHNWKLAEKIKKTPEQEERQNNIGKRLLAVNSNLKGGPKNERKTPKTYI